jgi:WD40 repeat protein
LVALAAVAWGLAGAGIWAGPPAVRKDLSGEPLPPRAIARMGAFDGQVQQVDRLCLSADGKTLATANAGQIRLWDVEANALRRAWTTPPVRFLAIAFSGDGKFLATAGEDNVVKLWDPQTGQARATIAGNPLPVPPGKAQRLRQVGQGPVPLAGNPGPCRSLAFSPDSKLLALGGGAGSDLRVWDAAGQQLQTTLKGPKVEITAVAFAPGGKLAGGYSDGSIRLWDLASGQARELGTHKGDGIACLAFTPDGKMLASSGGDDDRILLWNVAGGQVRHTLRGERFNGAALAFSADGTLLASCSANLKMEQLRFKPGPFPLPPPPLPPGKVQVVPPKGLAAFPPPPPPPFQPPQVSPDHTIRIWDVATGKEARKLARHNNQVHTLALAGGHIASGATDGVFLWDQEGHFLRRLGRHAGMVRRLTFGPDGKTLFTAGDDATIRQWEARTGKELRQIGMQGGGGTVAWTRDFRRAAMIANGGLAGLDLKTGSVQFQTAKQENTVAGLDYSPDGKLLASGTSRFLRLFDAVSGQEIRRIDAHGDLIIRLAFAPDGKRLASCSWDHTIAVWDVGTGQLAYRMPRQPGPLESIAYSPDGRWLATGSTGGILRLWDPASGRLARTLLAQGPIVFALTFSPDSRYLATTGPMQSLRVWEVASGKEILALEKGHRAEIICAGFSPDGKLLASGGWDASAVVWDWQESWREAAAKGTDLGPKGLEEQWSDLARANAAQALRAVATLTGAGDKAVPFLKDHIPAVKEASAKEIQKWLHELGSDKFAVREAATRNLQRLGKSVLPALRETLQGTQSLEVRRRLEGILSALQEGELSADDLRLVRAVQVLEQIGSKEARQVLRDLAQGSRGPLLRQEAREGLKRLGDGP